MMNFLIRIDDYMTRHRFNSYDFYSSSFIGMFAATGYYWLLLPIIGLFALSITYPERRS